MLELDSLLQEDLQLKNYWKLNLTGLPKAGHMVKSVNIPTEMLVTETKKYGSKKYTGFTPIETITLTFYENTSFDIYNYFKEWKDNIFDPVTKTFKVLSSETLKFKSGSIWYYRPTRDSRINTKIFSFPKLMILGMSETNLDHETGDPVEWSVTLAVEEFLY